MKYSQNIEIALCTFWNYAPNVYPLESHTVKVDKNEKSPVMATESGGAERFGIKKLDHSMFNVH